MAASQEINVPAAEAAIADAPAAEPKYEMKFGSPIGTVEMTLRGALADIARAAVADVDPADVGRQVYVALEVIANGDRARL